MGDETPYEGSDYYCDVALPHPERLEVVHDDDLVLAYHHTRPFWEHHIVVVPKRHVNSFTDFAPEQRDDLLAVLRVAQQVAARVEAERGEAAVLTNLGRYQDSKHLHVHVHSGRQLR